MPLRITDCFKTCCSFWTSCCQFSKCNQCYVDTTEKKVHKMTSSEVFQFFIFYQKSVVPWVRKQNRCLQSCLTKRIFQFFFSNFFIHLKYLKFYWFLLVVSPIHFFRRFCFFFFTFDLLDRKEFLFKAKFISFACTKFFE